MNSYRITGKDGGWSLVNLDRVIFVDFDDEEDEIIFDNILRVKVDTQDYAWIRREVLKKMFNLP